MVVRKAEHETVDYLTTTGRFVGAKSDITTIAVAKGVRGVPK